MESYSIKVQNFLGLPFCVCVKPFVFDFFPPVLRVVESQSFLAEPAAAWALVPFFILGSFFKPHCPGSLIPFISWQTCSHADRLLVLMSSKGFPFLLQVLNKPPLLETGVLVVSVTRALSQ